MNTETFEISLEKHESINGTLVNELAISSKAESKQVSKISGAVKSGDMEEGEPLAAAIFELFRRDLEDGAGQPSKRLENNGLLLIRDAKFRTVKDIVIMLLNLYLIISVNYTLNTLIRKL